MIPKSFHKHSHIDYKLYRSCHHRNLEMLDAAEKERISNLSSGMYLLFLAPVVTASVKLVIDMAVFMLSFLGSAGIG